MAPEFSRQSEKHNRDSLATADPEVLDLAHLARYTVGNRALEDELLGLFRTQMRTQFTAIAGAADAEQWRFATHTLKGVARSIGAWAIADTAERLERLDAGAGRDRLLETLHGQIAACEDEIDRITGLPRKR